MVFMISSQTLLKKYIFPLNGHCCPLAPLRKGQEGRLPSGAPSPAFLHIREPYNFTSYLWMQVRGGGCMGFLLRCWLAATLWFLCTIPVKVAHVVGGGRLLLRVGPPLIVLHLFTLKMSICLLRADTVDLTDI